MINLDKLINEDKVEELSDLLLDKNLDINDVEKIYYALKDNKIIVGQVAMNLSQRTSVHNRDEGYSRTMVKLLIDLSKNPIDMGARWAVAKNPHTPVEVLEFLSKDDVNLVRALVATNPSTPVKNLEKFFNDEKIVKDGLSGNPSTPIKLLKILASDNDKMVRLRLVENSSCSIEILKSLLDDESEDIKIAAKIALEARE